MACSFPTTRRLSAPFGQWGAAGGWARASTLPQRKVLTGPTGRRSLSLPPISNQRQRRGRERNGKERGANHTPARPGPLAAVLAGSWSFARKGNRLEQPQGGRAGAAAGCSALIIYPKKAGGANSGGQGPPPSKRPPGRKLGNAKKPGGAVNGSGGGPWALLAGGSPPAAVPEAVAYPVPAGRGGGRSNTRR